MEDTIVISNPPQGKIQMDRDLAALLGLIKLCITDKKGRKLKIKTIIKQSTLFNTYMIHCDLTDRDENLFNGDSSSIHDLGEFQHYRRTFERVTYSSEAKAAMRKMEGLNHITSIRIKVTDDNGDLIDFNGLPHRFEIEII